MIVTKQFVVLNLPKTGSTFVREVVKSIYEERESWLDRLLTKLKFKRPEFEELLMPHASDPTVCDQHGGYFQIPEQHKQKDIVSVIRNPYERFASQYSYRWWASHPMLEEQELKDHFPGFPELTIDDFVKYRSLATAKRKSQLGIPQDVVIGDQSIHFIQMFFTNPAEVFGKMSNAYLQDKKFLDDVADVKFLMQENLNNDLADYLSNYGFSEPEVNYARSHQRINVTAKSLEKTSQLNQSVLDFVEQTESVLLQLLASKGIVYDKPSTIGD